MVTYNRFDVLLKSLKSIEEQETKVDYIVVVDNGSTDGTPGRLRELIKDIDLVETNINAGYAAGLAFGIKYAFKKFNDIDYFWLMDDDSQPAADALKILLDIKCKFPFEGLLSVTGFIDNVWKGPIQFSKYRNKKQYSISPKLNLYEVDHALIDGALVDRIVVDKIGYPDGRFFMMCEDVEYCKRIKKDGYRIVLFENELTMNRLHYGGGGRFSQSNLWRGYYGARNHMLILREYFSWRGLLSYVIRQMKYLMASLMAKDWLRRVSLRLLGIWHGLLGVEGKTIDPKNF